LVILGVDQNIWGKTHTTIKTSTTMTPHVRQ
jgi:hypothetical protein